MLRALPAGLLLTWFRRRLARLYVDAAAHGPSLDHYLRPFRGPGGTTALLAHLRALTPGGPASHLAPASGRPVSIVCGRSDTLVPRSAGEQLNALLPGSTLLEVAGGHFAPEESPEHVAAALSALVTSR
jgi:pimeloyl-ACP methyl ester carboxylesterase